MAARVNPFPIGVHGTSLSAGRYAQWPVDLGNELQAYPEVGIGRVIIWNTGMGSQTSDWLAANAYRLAQLKPRVIFFEGGAINDCAIGPVTLVQAQANFDSMVAEWQAAIPGVVLVHQTMSPAAVDDVNRTQLQTYYDQERARAAYHGILSLNHTPAFGTIDASNTFNGDKLHPLPEIVRAAAYPLILSTARAQAAVHYSV